jgi:hypothetical protein
MSICSDSQAALKALQAVRTTSPLVQQCQRELNTTSLLGMQWGYTGSPDMLECEVMKSLTRSQGAALVRDSLDLSRPWESLDKMYKQGSVNGWSTNTGIDDEALVILKDGLEN